MTTWRIDVWNRDGSHKTGWPKTMSTADMTGARFRCGRNGLGALIPIEATILGHPQTLGISWGEFVQFSVSETGDFSDVEHLFYGDVRRMPSQSSSEEGKWRIVGLHSKRLRYIDLEGDLLVPHPPGEWVKVKEGENYDLGELARAAFKNLVDRGLLPFCTVSDSNIHLLDSQIGFSAHNFQDIGSLLDALCSMYNQPPGAPVGQLNQCVWYVGADRNAYFGVPDGGTITLSESDLIPSSGESIWEDVDAENVVTAVRWLFPYKYTKPTDRLRLYDVLETWEKTDDTRTHKSTLDTSMYSVVRKALLLEKAVKFQELFLASGSWLTYGVHLGFKITILDTSTETATVDISRIYHVNTDFGLEERHFARSYTVKTGDIIWWDADIPIDWVDVATGLDVGTIDPVDDSLTSIDAEVHKVTLDTARLDRLAGLFGFSPEGNAARWKTLGIDAAMCHQVTINKNAGGSVTIPLEAVEYVVETDEYMVMEWLAGQRADPETLAYWALVQEEAARQLDGVVDLQVRG